ncbi:hypothetical protein [Acinetobacter modestus]|uniref:hypothetical protein n=1 Tax=Acinetobacter modestus TaxID=1776740 RepID=UPI001F4A14C2|nr:hypothetical protein [Acinetobacter modestus]MCH7331855.1 hypothetical protein [Acinetobacter modestus]
MMYLIGGKSNGEAVDQADVDLKSETVLKKIGSFTGFERATEVYVRTQIKFDGETKTFYILKGEKVKNLRDEILGRWDWVKADVHVLD